MKKLSFLSLLCLCALFFSVQAEEVPTVLRLEHEQCLSANSDTEFLQNDAKHCFIGVKLYVICPFCKNTVYYYARQCHKCCTGFIYGLNCPNCCSYEVSHAKQCAKCKRIYDGPCGPKASPVKQETDFSLYIRKNKYSLYSVIGGKKFYQKGIFELVDNQVNLTIQTQYGDEKKRNGSIHFTFDRGLNVKISGNFYKMKRYSTIEAQLLGYAAEIYLTVKKCMKDKNFQPAMHSFIIAEIHDFSRKK